MEAGAPVVDGIESIVDAIPFKERTATSFSTCSVRTEEGPAESRDATTVKTRGADGERDDDGVNDRDEPKAPSDTDLVGTEEATDSGSSCSIFSILTSTGNSIDSAIHYFFSSVELGAQKLCCTCSSPGTGTSPSDSAAAMGADTEKLLSATTDEQSQTAFKTNQLDAIETTKSQDTMKSSKSHKSCKSQRTAKSVKSAKAPEQSKRRGCGILSLFANEEEANVKTETQDEVGSPKSLNEIIGETLDITTNERHILDTFSDDFESNQRSPLAFKTPKSQILLDEIEKLEGSFLQVQKAVSLEQLEGIKKRQDPYLQQMAAIRQRLQEQQELLKSAPDDVKVDFFRTISRAAVLNAEVETRRAELELKKIRLESLKVEEEMDRMMEPDETFDTMDGSVMTKESDDGIGSTLDFFAKFAAGKSWKKSKAQAVAE